MTKIYPIYPIVCCFLIGVICLIHGGCGTVDDPTLDFVGSELSISRIDDLSRTIELAKRESQADQREFVNNIRSGLNRWVTYSKDRIEQVDWSKDELFDSAAQNFEGVAVLKETDQLNFIDTDAHYLHEIIWLSSILNRIDQLPLRTYELYRLAADNFQPESQSQTPLVEIIAQLHPSLNEDQAKQLTRAFQWFDFVTVNVQLLPETEVTDEFISQTRLNDNASPIAAGVPGTGYQHFPWQTLTFGRGDYVQRAKLFMQGLNLLDLDSVLLAIDDSENPNGVGRPRPWAVGVPIGEHIYLFDTKLGLPIPGSSVGTIATLEDVKANPELLKQLNLSIDETLEEDSQYWVQEEDLNHLIGLIYVAPESVSQRFASLEASLIEAQNFSFVISPKERVERLAKIGDLDGIELDVWPIGIETHQFRQAVREALEDRTNIELRERLSWYFQNEYYIDEFPRYRTSRIRFFIGKYQRERDDMALTAIESFENLLYSDETIDNLAADSMLHMRLGVSSDINKDSAEFNRRISSIQAHMRLVRRDCNLFLAQTHFDNGSFNAVMNWLDITRRNPESVRWEESVIYLGGRALESQKDYDAAIAEYRKHPKALQAHGNLIRARMLTEAIEANYGEVKLAE